MNLSDELKKIAAKFHAERIEYAVCGGLAMAIYGMPRATLDIDIIVEPGSLDRALKAVTELGFTLEAAPMEFHEGKVRIHRVCKVQPGSPDALTLGLLLVTPATRKAWGTRREVKWEGGVLSVISPTGLIALKSFRHSGTDQDDIAYLRSIGDED